MTTIDRASAIRTAAPDAAADLCPTNAARGSLGAEPAPSLTVYFDGACPLCAAEIGVYQRCRGAEAIAFVDVSRPDTPLADGLDRDKALARFHVADADGRLVSGAAGFIALWRSLPGWRWLGRAASLPPLPWLLERAYRLFLPMRPMLRRVLTRN